MNVEIAQRLAARRKQAGLSQEALAERLGVSRQAVSKWERSESSPDTDNLIALAQLYGVSLDDLLYVDDQTRDDVVFEAADRAAERLGGASQEATASEGFGVPDSAAEAPSDVDKPGEEERKEKVHIGLDGIHVLDGDDYVHVSWRDGVHVKDGKKGDEVHVGWSGVHVKEAPRAEGADSVSDEGSAKTSDDEWFGATNDGFGGRDDEGNEVIVDSDGVIINGEHFDDWHEAHRRYGHGRGHNEGWGDPCGYTVMGEHFDTLDDARAQFGPEVGKSIPVRKHYLRTFEKSWVKFPYPLVVIIGYLLLGVFCDAWGTGLFLFFTIPLYYMVGHAIGSRRIVPLLSGAYPILVIAWFCYMAFVLNQPHPAWVVFLTIPLVEWFLWALSNWWRTRKRSKVASQNAPIDVEAQDEG